MTSRTAAGRYARALFDVARKEQADLAAIERDLSEFAQLVATHEGLQRALTNPAIPAAGKRGIIDQLLATDGTLSPFVGKLLRLLADADRLALLPDVAAAYEQRLMDHQQVVRAQVVMAMDLPPDRIGALREGLSRATGRDVQLVARVDPAIIGGAVAKIGSTVYDGSVTRQLEKMRQSLVDSAT
jgi:F-type H+-transporting ATPase subunit delta